MRNDQNIKKVPQRSYGANNPNLPSKLPILGLGCSSFSSFFFSKEERVQLNLRHDDDLSWVTPSHPLVTAWIETILHAVKVRGVNLLDTAPWYGHGSSEMVIGMAMDKLLDSETGVAGGLKRADIIVNTKVGRYSSEPKAMFDFSAKRVHQSVQTSLERLKCDYIDVLQLHDPEFAPSVDLLIEETIPAMVELKEKGLVRAIGMTGYPLSIHREILRRSRDEKGIVFDQCLTYCHYNLHDQSLFTSGFANWCRETIGAGLICAAPLSMGLLTRSGPPKWHPASDELKNACRNAAFLCEKRNIDIARLATVFAMGKRDIPCTILGLKNVEEVERAVEVANLFHGEEDQGENEMAVLERILEREEWSILIDELLDRANSPFKDVWRSGEFEWDAIKDVDEFWQGVDGGKIAAEERMRHNS